jgi:5-formaminoimidazole-4-carboxamide-1-(beta)-D-ribofuranosyl 5'-monophosphate synthetase
MIELQDMQKIFDKYDQTKITIGTIGSHSSLNIFKGAKEEGLRTVCICKEKDAIMYQKYPIVDELIIVKDYAELLNVRLQDRLRCLNTILIPHGSFTAYLSTEQLTVNLKVPMMGNRKLLHWEVNRKKQEEWLHQAGLKLPATFKTPDDIDRLTIAKLQGAKGGRGYFLTNSPKSFYQKADEMIKRNLITKQDLETIHLQEYILGVNVYPSYFSSILNNDVELLAMDRRYETTVDSIGKIPADQQLEINITPTYTVIGNFPIVLRESLLPDIMRMGEAVHKKATQDRKSVV